MNRFEILKYTILFEEAIKKEVIELVDSEGGDASKLFDINFKVWRNDADYVSNKDSNRDAVWKSSHGEFNNLFRGLKTNYSSIFYHSSIFKGFITRKRDMNKLLTANRLVRNTLAHPLKNLYTSLNKISNFNSFGKHNNFENITYFYKCMKEIL